MKFGELKGVCRASFYVIHAVNARGERACEVINLHEAVDGHLRLSRYDDVEIIAFSTITTLWGDGAVAALEVDVRV